MNELIYNYLGEIGICIDATQDYIKRIERNIDEPKGTFCQKDIKIKIIPGYPRAIIKIDKNYAFASTKENYYKKDLGIDFLRYNTKVQTIWRPNPNEFLVESYLESDESGALKCLKNWCFEQKVFSQKYSLIHSSLVQINGNGILITGPSKSGKSTLMIKLLENLGGSFIAEENVLIYYNTENILTGSYLPKPIHLKIGTIANCDKLKPLLFNEDKWDATQNIDIDALRRIVNARAYHVDASLDFSRQSFIDYLGLKKIPNSKIDYIIYPGFALERHIKNISPEMSIEMLKNNEIEKNSNVARIKQAYQIEKPKESRIVLEWVRNLKNKVSIIRSPKDLTKNFLEDLIS